jgi:Ca-activated chloride channel family protein
VAAVTFLSSWRLVFLIAPVALLIAYLLVQRARRKVAIRFTSVDMLASVAPRRPGWQRHIPAVALLASLVVLVLGLAQPVRAVRTPRQRATVMLTLDTSGSMIANDVIPSRLAAAQQEARRFVNALPPGIQIGLVSFNTTAIVLVSPTTDRSTIVAAIDGLQAAGGTATGDAIQLGLNAIAALPPGADGKPAPAAIVLMSDGTPTIGHGDQSPAQAVTAAAAAAKQAGVRINTIAFGTQSGAIFARGQMIPVPSDPGAMAQIASASGGQTFTAASGGQLKSVYQQIGRAVGYDVHHRDVSAWFTTAALIIAIIAAASALLFNERLL